MKNYPDVASAARLLAIDTATPVCSVALRTADGVTGLTEHEARRHTGVLLPMCDRLLQGQAPEGIILSAGPGAFTGLRIGASVALGLACGWGIPLMPVSSLALLAATAAQGRDAVVLALLDARMDAVYAGCYRLHGGQITALDADCLCAPADIPAQWYAQADVVAGPGLAYAAARRGADVQYCPDVLPDARFAFIVAQQGCWQAFDQPPDLFYLRNDVTQS